MSGQIQSSLAAAQCCSIQTAAPMRNKVDERIRLCCTWRLPCPTEASERPAGRLRCELWRRQVAAEATEHFLSDFRVLNELKTFWNDSHPTAYFCQLNLRFFFFFAIAEFSLGFDKHPKRTETQRNLWPTTERTRARTESLRARREGKVGGPETTNNTTRTQIE